MVFLRKLDAFTKTRPDLQQKSAVGGFITCIAGGAAGLLFLGQLYLYIVGNPSQSLILSQSTSIPLIPLEPPVSGSTNQQKSKRLIYDQVGRLPLKLHVTFPHVSCSDLDVAHDGAQLSTRELDTIHGPHTIVLRTPTKSEMHKALGGSSTVTGGCTIHGRLRPKIVAGHLAITLNRMAWIMAAQRIAELNFNSMAQENNINNNNNINAIFQRYNVSHYVHSIEFGQPFAKQKDKPLHNVAHIIGNESFGIGIVQSYVKLIPTVRQGLFFQEETYQLSVVDTIIQPHTMIASQAQQLPGMLLTYDFTPLTVYHHEGRDNFLIFLSSLISIVGGVFVTVGLLTGCLVHSAQAVAKKID